MFEVFVGVNDRGSHRRDGKREFVKKQFGDGIALTTNVAQAWQLCAESIFSDQIANRVV